PARLDVGGRHARGVVDHQDVMLPLGRAAVEAEAHDRIQQQQHREQLQEQQNVLAQPLEQAVDVQILNALAPQECARHLQRLTLELEEVEQDDQERDEQEEQAQEPRQRELITELKVLAQPFVDCAIGPENVK